MRFIIRWDNLRFGTYVWATTEVVCLEMRVPLMWDILRWSIPRQGYF